MSLDNLDTYRTIDLELDLANDYIEPVTLSAGDNEGRVIRVSLYNGTAAVDGSSYTARLLYNPQPQNPNSAGGYVTMTAVEGAATATWTVSVPGSSLIPGVALMAIRVSEGDNVICTRTFDAIVESGVIHEGASETTSALSEFWEAVENIQQEIDAFAKELRVSASVDGTKWTETEPSVTVTQKTTDDYVNVDLAFHGIVGGEGFAWNILRGTNSGAALVDTGYWTNGTWGSNGDAYVSAIDITDAPVADLTHGWHLERAGNVSLIRQTEIPVTVGATYVLSVYARGENTLQFGYSDGSAIYSGIFTLTNEWAQYSWAFTPTASSMLVNFRIGSTTVDANADICGMKLELAQNSDAPTATAWSPSPWDITPQLSMTASVDATSGTPSVEVTQDTSGNATAFDLAFSGLRGSDGQGVPTGGSSGQFLVKNSSTNYDTAWSNTITANTTIAKSSPQLELQNTAYAYGDVPTSQINYPVVRYSHSGTGSITTNTNVIGTQGIIITTAGNIGAQTLVRSFDSSGANINSGWTLYANLDGSTSFAFLSTNSKNAILDALGISTLQATVAALADTTATLAAAHDADADAICALYVDLIHHDVRDIDSVPDAYRAQVSQQLELDGDDWQDPYVDDDTDRAIAPDEPLPLSDDADAGE